MVVTTPLSYQSATIQGHVVVMLVGAKLPTREEVLVMLMAVMQAPITKLVRTLNDVPAKLTRGVAAVRDQKQEAVA